MLYFVSYFFFLRYTAFALRECSRAVLHSAHPRHPSLHNPRPTNAPRAFSMIVSNVLVAIVWEVFAVERESAQERLEGTHRARVLSIIQENRRNLKACASPSVQHGGMVEGRGCPRDPSHPLNPVIIVLITFVLGHKPGFARGLLPNWKHSMSETRTVVGRKRC